MGEPFFVRASSDEANFTSFALFKADFTGNSKLSEERKRIVHSLAGIDSGVPLIN